MDELAREVASLRDAVVPAWTEARSERLRVGVGQLRRRRRARRAVSIAAIAMAACGVLYLRVSDAEHAAWLASGSRGIGSNGLSEPGIVPHLPAVIPAAKGGAVEPADDKRVQREPIHLADGSEVRMLSNDAEVGVERNRPQQVALRLETGVARFDVVPNTRRQFTVRAGSVEVLVLGTVFDVERGDGRVRVEVSRGKVRVRHDGATSLVKAGQSLWFDEADASESARSPQPSAAKTHARGPAAREESAQAETPRSWRSLSQSGDYEGAYRLLMRERNAVEDDSGALLDAADAARLSGHPEAALQYLRKVLDRHPNSPVAPLAAFTMGRVLLERLGQPLEAADAFSTARRLAPQGSLAQDALAREVEAWSKAGHPEEAYQRARTYVTKYPEGRRLHAVQLYGGLSAP